MSFCVAPPVPRCSVRVIQSRIRIQQAVSQVGPVVISALFIPTCINKLCPNKSPAFNHLLVT